MGELNTFELKRQAFHLFLGISIVFLVIKGFLNKEILLILIIAGLVISYISKTVRIPVIYYLLQKFERKEELEKFPGKGIIFYFVGAYASLLIFTKETAMASIIILALGDSVSHFYGLHYGKIKHPLSKTKFLEGTLAGFAAGFAGALLFVPLYQALFGSLAAMIIEAIEIKVGAEQIDDNLIVPIVAGIAMFFTK